MEIIIAKNAGFCFGVKRAVETAFAASGENVCILGELIHNKSVIKKLAEKNIKTVNSIDEIKSGKIIIRSHGVSPEIYNLAKEKNLEIIDCTCSFVSLIQQKVKEFFDKGYHIIIIGEKNHPEVIGINGWCGNLATIISSENENFDVSAYEKLCIVAQTTQNPIEFDKIIRKIDIYPLKTVEVFNTICYTTIERNKQAEDLSRKCDCVIVIGGLNSSNTKKLYDVSCINCKNVYWVEKADELDYKKFIKYNKVAVLAGASTPIEDILEVKQKMDEIANKEEQKENSSEKEMSMEQVMSHINATENSNKRGQVVKTTIVLANDEGLMLQIGAKKGEILLSKDEINADGSYDKTQYSAGDEMEVVIIESNPLTVSRKRLLSSRAEDSKVTGLSENSEFSVTIDGFNKGGLTAKYGSAAIFIPASQIRFGFVKAEEFDKYVGKELRVRVIKIEGKKIVASQKAIIEEERNVRNIEKQKIAEDFFASIEIGKVVSGKVVRFAEFGAFVNVDGFDCLAHVSDLCWTNVKKPEDILKKDETYNFMILKVDKEKQQVSLGYKQLQPRPWDLAVEKYPVNSVLKGKVVRLTGFGAFIEVEPGIDGLVHVSQISNEWIENPTSALTIGQEVDVLVLDINPETEKLTLSIKALLPPPAVEPTPAPEQASKNEERAKKFDTKEYKPRDQKEKRERKPREDNNEPREWLSNENGGASIGEMLKDLDIFQK